jgi:hypothetical protein
MIALTPEIVERMLLLACELGELRLAAPLSAHFCERLSKVPFVDDEDLDSLGSEIEKFLVDAKLRIGSLVH